jgi:cell division protein FtsB
MIQFCAQEARLRYAQMVYFKADNHFLEGQVSGLETSAKNVAGGGNREYISPYATIKKPRPEPG